MVYCVEGRSVALIVIWSLVGCFRWVSLMSNGQRLIQTTFKVLLSPLVSHSLPAYLITTFSISQDVANVGRNASNNGKVAAGKPVIAKRANGVKTRSMSIGGTTKDEIMLAPTARSGAFGNNEERNVTREVFQRGGRMAADPNSYQITGNADDIDDRDKEDPLCATAYVADMYAQFREKESSTSVRPVFMESQSHINERMRAILVDWLVEVHLKFKLVPETLYLTINLIDRFLEREEVSRPKLQLVGVTSLLIASKYEEIYPPELRDLVYICDRAYTKQDVSAID